MPTIAIRIATVLLLMSAAALTRAEIYQCVDSDGRTVFSDHKCSDDDSNVRVVQPRVNVAPFKDVLEGQEESSRVIYRGSRVGRKSRFLDVSIYEETESYIIFEVEVYYRGPAHGRGEYRVMPNIHWRARSFSTSDVGVSSGFARVELGSRAKDGDVSDVITLQLWQYIPGESPSVLETRVIPYKKRWSKRA